MASDQIEFCGECEFYSKCINRANEGRLRKCYMSGKEDNKDIKKGA